MTEDEKREYRRRYMVQKRREAKGIFEPSPDKNVAKSTVWTIPLALQWERITRELRGVRN